MKPAYCINNCLALGCTLLWKPNSCKTLLPRSYAFSFSGEPSSGRRSMTRRWRMAYGRGNAFWSVKMFAAHPVLAKELYFGDIFVFRPFIFRMAVATENNSKAFPIVLKATAACAIFICASEYYTSAWGRSHKWRASHDDGRATWEGGSNPIQNESLSVLTSSQKVRLPMTRTWISLLRHTIKLGEN